MTVRAAILVVLLQAVVLAAPTPYTTADGMCKAVFPAAVPDRPGGFILLHNGGLYTFGLMNWAKDPQRYYEGSRTLRLIEPNVTVRPVQAGPVAGQEFHKVTAEGRHTLTQEFAANGNVYEFSVTYSGEQPPAEVSDFFRSISFSSQANNPERLPRSRLIQCAVTLDGLATQLLDHPQSNTLAQDRCPAGGSYVLQRKGSTFTIHCAGGHHSEAGVPDDYPRIDQFRQVWQGPQQPLPRPDPVTPPPP